MSTTNINLTPTQSLLIEVLTARHRLGEQLWTFSSQYTKQLEKLAEAGWVGTMHGITENTVRAYFTDAGKARWLSFDYTNPVEVEGWNKRLEEAQQLKERFGGEKFWEKQ